MKKALVRIKSELEISDKALLVIQSIMITTMGIVYDTASFQPFEISLDINKQLDASLLISV